MIFTLSNEFSFDQEKKEITYDPPGGENISTSALKLLSMKAQIAAVIRSSCSFKMLFNGVEITAEHGDTAESIVARYHAECSKRAEAYARSPVGIEQARKAEEFRKQAAESEAQGIAEFQVIDKETWDKAVEVNSDAYGSCVVRYAARWAAMMEAEIRDGAEVRGVAKDCSHKADTEGITGFMYGCAVSILSKVWARGEELRQWHNLETQIGSEGVKANESGAVLNPAVLVIGGG